MHSQEISEFTVCYRFLLNSYNDGWTRLIRSEKEKSRYVYYEALGNGDTGFEYEGYQALAYMLFRNVTGGGLGNQAHPVYHHTLLPRNVPTSRWLNSCNSYSSSLQKLHLYHDGLKAFSYHYKDEEENSLPANLFEKTEIGTNMRDLLGGMCPSLRKCLQSMCIRLGRLLLRCRRRRAA